MFGFGAQHPALRFEVFAHVPVGEHVQSRDDVGGETLAAGLHQREVKGAICGADRRLVRGGLDVELRSVWRARS